MTAASAKTRFEGFPAGARATAVPSLFFSALLPQIEDETELRVTLYAIYALGRRKGYPNFISEHELQAEAPLLAALDGNDPQPALDRLTRGLGLAVERGSLLRLDVEQAGLAQALYFLNTPASRRALGLVKEGRLNLGRTLPAPGGTPSERPNAFQLYEANVGPITPLVAEELREAEQLYPHEWLEEAMREAALLNKRSWRYIAAILRRWATEGRKRETAGRDPGEGDSARAQLLRRYRDLSGSD